MSYIISELALRVIETRYPHLQGLTERYRMLNEMIADANWEYDRLIKDKDLDGESWGEDDDAVFLHTEIEFLENEAESTGRQLTAILRSEYRDAREG